MYAVTVLKGHYKAGVIVDDVFSAGTVQKLDVHFPLVYFRSLSKYQKRIFYNYAIYLTFNTLELKKNRII